MTSTAQTRCDDRRPSHAGTATAAAVRGTRASGWCGRWPRRPCIAARAEPGLRGARDRRSRRSRSSIARAARARTRRAFPLLVGGRRRSSPSCACVLTAVTTHGVGDVLFTTPQFTLPQLLGGFTVGGTDRAPGRAAVARRGLRHRRRDGACSARSTRWSSHYELVQSTPRAFYELGLVVVVALAFVPSTLAAIARRPRSRPGPHRRARRAPRPAAPPDRAGPRARAGTRGHAGRVDGRARLRARRVRATRPRRRLVRASGRCSRSAARSSRSSASRAPSPRCSGSAAPSGSAPRSLLASSRHRAARATGRAA